MSDRSEREAIRDLLSSVVPGQTLQNAGAAVREGGSKRALVEWLRFPEVTADVLSKVEPRFTIFAPRLFAECVEDGRYAPYIERQQAEVARLRADDGVHLPAALQYNAVAGLSSEMVERLTVARPTTLGAASRIRGITPAALAAILVHVRARRAA